MTEKEQIEEAMMEVRQAISDLGVVSSKLEGAVNDIMNTSTISSKGMRRVLRTLISFPNGGVEKVKTDDEGALVLAFNDKFKVIAQQMNLVAHLKQLEDKLAQQGE